MALATATPKTCYITSGDPGVDNSGAVSENAFRDLQVLSVGSLDLGVLSLDDLKLS